MDRVRWSQPLKCNSSYPILDDIDVFLDFGGLFVLEPKGLVLDDLLLGLGEALLWRHFLWFQTVGTLFTINT